MNDAKYVGLDVHQATISAAVLDSDGRLIMESILETMEILANPKAMSAIRQDREGKTKYQPLESLDED